VTPAGQAKGTLDGIRVVDLSRVLAGPLCTQLLGDHGADVIKVEGPLGDDTRTWGPPFDGSGVSAYYNGLNRNKRNICIDMSTDDGRAIVHDLIRTADVVVENFKTSTMARWGLGYEALRVENPALVYCCISGYGADGTGPLGSRPGYDAALQAGGGLMSINGTADGPPLRVGVPIVDIVTALVAVSGILMSLVQRSVTGVGQFVDACLFDSVLNLLHPHSASWLVAGTIPQRTGAAHPTVVPYQVFDTASGPLFVGVGNDRQFSRLVDVLALGDIANDPRFATNSGRLAHRDELVKIIEDRFVHEDAEELAARLVAGGLPCSPVLDVGAVLSSAHALHRSMVLTDGTYRGIASPIKLSEAAGNDVRRPAVKGEHTDEILAELGRSTNEIARLRECQAVLGDSR
jgi:crotonobetainyl-CoA:carnitine CoA-transferase CaiB-like acyl-CoA transferase